MTKPITPTEALKKKPQQLPDEVLEVFNETIIANLNGGVSTFSCEMVANEIARRMNLGRGEVYSKKYLDVEDIYRKAGWQVEYDQPAWNESDFKATFTFTAKKRGG